MLQGFLLCFQFSPFPDCGFVTLETSIGWSRIGCVVTLPTVNQRCMDAYEITNTENRSLFKYFIDSTKYPSAVQRQVSNQNWPA